MAALFHGLDSMFLENLPLPSFGSQPNAFNPTFANLMTSWEVPSPQLFNGNSVFALDENTIDALISSDDFQSVMEEEGSPSNWIIPPIGCNETLMFNQICSDILLNPTQKQSAFEEVPHWIVEEAFSQRKPFYYIFYNPQDENAWRWDNQLWSQSGTWRKITEGQLERVSFSLKSDRRIKRMATRRTGHPNGVVVVIYFFKVR